MATRITAAEPGSRVQITRSALIEVVELATLVPMAQSSREKYLEVARTASEVAVGWFHCAGVGCPARQAHRKNTAFQTAYDQEMWRRFPHLEYETFIAEVIGEPATVA